jgi:hypothetical protein
LDQLSAAQIVEWEAYDRIDPIGSWRQDFNFAKIECLITNVVNALYHEEGVEPVMKNPTDFMIKWGQEIEEPEPQQQSISDMKETLKTIFSGSKRKKVARKIQPDKYQGR